jgi:putative ABC transport system substrate-binding protein
VTGVHLFIGALDPKKLGLLRELVPQPTVFGVLLNPSLEDFQIRLAAVQEAARTIGQQIHILHASTERELDAAFAALGRIRAGARNFRHLGRSISPHAAHHRLGGGVKGSL